MENKRRTVEEFITKGEKLMEDPKSPKFLGKSKKSSMFYCGNKFYFFFFFIENHVHKLKEAWTLANEKAQERKNALSKFLEMSIAIRFFSPSFLAGMW